MGSLTVDPTGRVPVAFWTHRPRRRPLSQQVLAAMPLADRWPGVLGLPFNYGAVAAGQRVELLPTGYGPGGAALLVTRRGHRTLVVGPTTEQLTPRPADDLVLCAPAAVLAPPPNWLAELTGARRPVRVSVPDSGAAHALVAALREAGVPWRGPRWLGASSRGARVQITIGGPGRRLDLRPQARLGWLVDFARAVRPQAVSVYGPRAHTLADGLVRAGLPAAVIHGPLQLTLGEPPPRQPAPPKVSPRRTEGPSERR